MSLFGRIRERSTFEDSQAAAAGVFFGEGLGGGGGWWLCGSLGALCLVECGCSCILHGGV